jgi:hypothetical protein
MSCEVKLRFNPSANGAEPAELTAVTDGSPAEPSSQLSGEGVAAELSFEPGSLAFGLLEVHSESTEQTLEIHNAGAAPAHLETLGINGPGANEFSIGNTNCFGATLQPGQGCFLVVRFNPQNEGTFDAALRAQVDGGAGFEAPLSGSGARPLVTATPDPADFGEAGVGTLGTLHTLTLTNSGELPAGFFIAIISGGDVTSFHMVEEDCTGHRIDPGESCTAVVRFTPVAAGLRTATASFFGDGEGALQIPISGTGVAAKATLVPGAHDFGAQAIGGAGPAGAFTVDNEGAAPVEVQGASISGLDPDQFRLSSDSCTETTLAPGASCSLGARFAPDVVGAQSAVLRVRTSAGTQTAALSGQGVPAPGQQSAPGTVGFSFPKSLRLGQAGSSALRIADARCESSRSCVLTVTATLVARFHRGGRLVSRQLNVANTRLTLAPGARGPVKIEVGAPGAGFSAARSTLRLRLYWSSAEATGSASRNPRLHG